MTDFIIPKPTDFEPPKYLSSLIQAVNDGAKLAQTGAFSVAAAGLYLLAVAFSVSDTDLILDHPASFANIGVQVSPPVAFGVGSVIFVLLHVFTLLRYAMLMKNLDALKVELKGGKLTLSDQDRCLQLLTNDTFLMSAIVPKSSRLGSHIFSVVAFMMMVILPISVIVILQLSAIRLQDLDVLWAQRASLAADLGLLIWFYDRTIFSKKDAANLRFRQPRLIAKASILMLLPAFLLYAECNWIVQPAVGQKIISPVLPGCGFVKVLEQPLDNCLCPKMSFGCRYLSAPDKILIASELSDTLTIVREDAKDDPDNIFTSTDLPGKAVGSAAKIQGVYLERRHLRNANLENSELYRATFSFADLDDAELSATDIPYSDFFFTQLIGADMAGSYLRQSSFLHADLSSADLTLADLFKADLQEATMVQTTLVGTDLQGADLTGANLQGAQLGCFIDPDPTNPVTRCTNLKGAKLQGADLTCQRGPSLKSPVCPDLTGAIIDQNTNFAGAKYERGTIWPDSNFLKTHTNLVFVTYKVPAKPIKQPN